MIRQTNTLTTWKKRQCLWWKRRVASKGKVIQQMRILAPVHYGKGMFYFNKKEVKVSELLSRYSIKMTPKAPSNFLTGHKVNRRWHEFWINVSFFRCVLGYNPKIPNGSLGGKAQAEYEKPETVHQGWARCANVINLMFFFRTLTLFGLCAMRQSNMRSWSRSWKGEKMVSSFSWRTQVGSKLKAKLHFEVKFKAKGKTIFSNRLFCSLGHCYSGQQSIWVGSQIKKLLN